MPKGISLHIGLNQVKASHYTKPLAPLLGAEYDAKDLQQIAIQNNFERSDLLPGNQAKKKVVTKAIQNAAIELMEGDIFFISFSGHGGQIPDINGEEDDALDETWCLYDGQITDDELDSLWATFRPGVRILVVEDCCNSGNSEAPIENAIMEILATSKFMGKELSLATYLKNKQFYDKIISQNTPLKPIKAYGLRLSACRDGEKTKDGNYNGAFTEALKAAWGSIDFPGTYETLYEDVLSKLEAIQNPQLNPFGNTDFPFTLEKPFTV